MFKNTLVEQVFRSPKSIRTTDNDAGEFTHDYCVSEAFRGDLSTGSIILGEHTSIAHGLSTRSSGLLAMTRAYSQQDRMRVLNIFEQACHRSTRFSFHTTIISGGKEPIPVLCTGETLVSSDGQNGVIKGVFVFSRPASH